MGADAGPVKRPDFPSARFMGTPISREQVEAALGGSLPVGAEPLCDRCLSPCPGLRNTPFL